MPSVSPADVSGKNLTSRSIIVYWSPIPKKSHRGILTGYLVRFRNATSKESSWKEIKYSRAANNGIISNLLTFHPYYFKIAGMTGKGAGAYSKEFKVWTGEACKLFYASQATLSIHLSKHSIVTYTDLPVGVF